VDGRTLAELVPERGLPIDQMLKLAIPLTDAVSAAHQRGITHRDLKPTNIMVTGDGRVKVLDFGLAKLAEEGSAGATGTLLPTEVLTGEGRIVGTVAYMSPEQAEGRPVDPRSDIFSLGIILYEMATGQRPFKGETSVSIISSIMKDTPASISDLNAGLPRDLARIVKRSLVKDPEHRYQTAKDLRNELEALKDDLASGVIEAPPVAPAAVIPPQRSGMGLWIGAVIAGVAVLAGGAALYLYSRQSQKPSEPARGFDGVKLTRLTNTGKAALAAMSPDGKYVVHVVDDGDQSLWIRQVATTSNVQIVAPAAVRYDGLTFAPDGNYIFYSTYPTASGGSNVASLYQLPVLGGTPRRVLEDIDSPVTFAPDGKRFAFLRGYQTAGESAIMVANVDGSDVKRLAVRKVPDNFPLTNVAWSPDGKRIAAPVNVNFATGQPAMTVLVFDAETGKDTPIGSKHWDNVGSVAWLGAGGLAVTAVDAGGSPQLWYLSFPAGDARRITNDLNNYYQLSVAGDAGSLVTVQGDRVSHIWVTGDGDLQSASQITSGAARFDMSPAWTPDGKVLYASNASGGNLDIWIADADGRNARQLTVDSGYDDVPTVSPDGRTVVFHSSRGGTQVWRMDADGANQTQLSKTPGSVLPMFSPDGRSVLFTSVGAAQRSIWTVPIGGGEPIRVIAPVPPDADPARVTLHATFVARDVSPDGKLLVGSFLDRAAHGFRVGLVSVETGDLVRQFNHLFHIIAFTRDGRAFTYPEVDKAGVWNLWNQPIDGGAPKQVTNFTSDQIFSFAWSRDGKRLAVARGTITNDVVLVSNLPRAR
jgi:Tol biopolymer transport system component